VVSEAQPPPDDPQASRGAAFYAASVAGVGLVQSALWLYARHAKLISPEVAKAYLLAILTFPVFLVSVPVAFLSPAAAEIMWGIVALTRGLVRRPIQTALTRWRPSPA
jgi:hypothetical protein